jgi:hypothetical protein
MDAQQQTYVTDATAVALDEEFRELTPRATPAEQKLLDAGLQREGCQETLVLWPCQGRKLLLVGYELFPTLRLYKIPFRVVENAFACRDDARMFIVVHQLGRQNLSAVAVSYLRGLRYQGARQAHGGDRRSERFQTGFATGKTAAALAEIFGVRPAMVRRDAQVTTAVNRIAMNCGKEVKCRLLAREAGLNRSVVVALARLPAEEQKAVVERWLREGKLGRAWRQQRPRTSITLPFDAPGFGRLVRKLEQCLGSEQAAIIGKKLACPRHSV